MSPWITRTVAALAGVTISVTLTIGAARLSLSWGTDGKTTASAAVVYPGGARSSGVSTCVPLLKKCDDTDRVKVFNRTTVTEGPMRLSITHDSSGHADVAVGLSGNITNKTGTLGLGGSVQKKITQADDVVTNLGRPTLDGKTAAALLRNLYQPTSPRVELSQSWKVQQVNDKAMQQWLAGFRARQAAAAAEGTNGTADLTIPPTSGSVSNSASTLSTPR